MADKFKQILARINRQANDYSHTERIDFTMTQVFDWARNPALLDAIDSLEIRTISYVPNGGLIPAAVLTYALRKIALRPSILTEIQLTKPSDKVDLFVDDIVNSGQTAKSVLEAYPKAYFTAVSRRPDLNFSHNRLHRLLLDFSILVPAATWIKFPWEQKNP